MKITCQIVSVMESWPLQLEVTSNQQTYHVFLTLETELMASLPDTESIQLSPEQFIEIEGEELESTNNLLRANKITVL